MGLATGLVGSGGEFQGSRNFVIFSAHKKDFAFWRRQEGSYLGNLHRNDVMTKQTDRSLPTCC